jgi:hypothetical protein
MISELKCAYDSPYCDGEPVKYRLILGDVVTLCSVHVNAFKSIIDRKAE